MMNNSSLYNGHAFPIVGIGASAGGLEALELFVKNITADSGMAYIIVQHLSPDYKSLMVELLSKHTSLKVLRVEDGVLVQPNTIYLIPPRKSLTIFHRKLYLTELHYGKVLNLPIDVFFRSLSDDQGEKAVGIVLSGTGSDGTLGIRAIKGTGGMVICQDPETAKFDGMPKSAINTGLVDYVLPPEKMPERIKKYFEHFFDYKTENADKSLLINESILTKILGIIKNKSGIDFTFYKQNTIIRRLERRISINQINNIEDYISLLLKSEDEAAILSRDLLINVTKFFRDSEAFDLLKEKVIPEIIKNKKPADQIRVWSIGCSTGEEAYSMSMLFCESLEQEGKYIDIKVFATDIDREAIEYAGLGYYPESIIADVGPERLRKFFLSKNDGYQINESIRKMVIFATHNAIKDPPFSKIDLVCCRNMLIYLKPNVQKRVLSLFHFSLNKGGFLFLGNSESIGELTNMFSVIDSKWKIYVYKEGLYMPRPNELILPALSKENVPLAANIRLKGNRADTLTDIIHQGLINEYVPPSIIIDETGDVVYIIGNVNNYISLPSGKISFNIQKILKSDLSTAVNVAIHKLKKDHKEVYYKNFQIRKEEKAFIINLRIKLLEIKNSRRELVIISFEEVADDIEKHAGFFESGTASIHKQRIQDMEQELNYTKENLQAAIEELETSNEELQSTNEELISSNEELQSTNEELQSVNEELYTVNSEHQKKIEELTQLNNDINNLLKNTNVGTIFLDQDLLIRKWTPAIKSVINLIETDVGRPIHHISHNTIYENFISDIRTVLSTLRTKEVEVKGFNGEWFLMRILPYRTIENAVDGVVITFFEITERKKFEEVIQRERELLYRVLDNSPICKTMVDLNGNIIYANHHAQQLLGLKRSDINKKRFDSPDWSIADEEGNEIMPEDLPFSIVVRTKKPIYGFIHYIIRKTDKKKVLLSISGAPVFDENGAVMAVIFAIIDITINREEEKRLLFERDLLLNFLELNTFPALIADSLYRIKFYNDRAKKLLPDLDRSKTVDHYFRDNADKAGREHGLISLISESRRPVLNSKQIIRSSGQQEKEIILDAYPIVRKDQFLGAIFLLKDKD